MAISLCMGLHATHMFVPPTPGPLAVAGILSADLGQVILFGALVSIPVAASIRRAMEVECPIPSALMMM